MNIWKNAIFLVLTALLQTMNVHAATMPADLEQIDFFDGNKLRFVAGTASYTYPSGQMAQFALRFRIENKIIRNNKLEKGLVQLELVQISPDGDTTNDGFQQMHCKEVIVIDLLEDWIARQNLNGYNRFQIKINLPIANLKLNPTLPPWSCNGYTTPQVLFE